MTAMDVSPAADARAVDGVPYNGNATNAPRPATSSPGIDQSGGLRSGARPLRDARACHEVPEPAADAGLGRCARMPRSRWVSGRMMFSDAMATATFPAPAVLGDGSGRRDRCRERPGSNPVGEIGHDSPGRPSARPGPRASKHLAGDRLEAGLVDEEQARPPPRSHPAADAESPRCPDGPCAATRPSTPGGFASTRGVEFARCMIALTSR